MVVVVERLGELGEQGLESDPQLQRRLAAAAGVEVGAGAEQEGLAGVDPLAAAQHPGDPFLGAQVFLATFAPRCAGRLDVDLAGLAVGSLGGLLAAAVADPHGDRPLRRQGRGEGVGGGHRVGVEGVVEEGDARPPRRASSAASSAVAAASQAAASSGPSNGSKARIAVARESGTSGGVTPASASRGRRRRRLGRGGAASVSITRTLSRSSLLAARQVAAVGERQRAGEVELRESEEGAQGMILAGRVGTPGGA